MFILLDKSVNKRNFLKIINLYRLCFGPCSSYHPLIWLSEEIDLWWSMCNLQPYKKRRALFCDQQVNLSYKFLQGYIYFMVELKKWRILIERFETDLYLGRYLWLKDIYTLWKNKSRNKWKFKKKRIKKTVHPNKCLALLKFSGVYSLFL